MLVVAKKKQGRLTVTHSDIQTIRATSHWRTIARSRPNELNNTNKENNKPLVCFLARNGVAMPKIRKSRLPFWASMRSTFSRVSYDMPGSYQRFARARAFRDAEDRAAQEIAENIQTRLASFFVAGT